MQEQIIKAIENIGGRVLSESELYMHQGNFPGLYFYEDCPSTNDWVLRPDQFDEFDSSLLIVTPEMLPMIDDVVRSYFEV